MKQSMLAYKSNQVVGMIPQIAPFLRNIIYGIQNVVLFRDSLFRSPHHLRKAKFN